MAKIMKLKFTAAFLRARNAVARARADIERLSGAQAIATAPTVYISRWLDDAKTQLAGALIEHERVCPPIWLAMNSRFNEVNGKAARHTLDAHDALECVEAAEKRLDSLGVPLKLRTGVEVWQQSAGPRANSYEYDVIGTRFGLLRDASGGWELIAVTRVTVSPRRAGKTTIIIGPAAQEAIIRHALEGVEVRAAANASAGEC